MRRNAWLDGGYTCTRHSTEAFGRLSICLLREGGLESCYYFYCARTLSFQRPGNHGNPGDCGERVNTVREEPNSPYEFCLRDVTDEMRPPRI